MPRCLLNAANLVTTAAAMAAGTSSNSGNGRHFFLSAALAAQQLLKSISSHSTFARAEGPEVASASTGYLLSTAESPRPDQFAVRNADAMEVLGTSATVVKALLHDLVSPRFVLPGGTKKDLGSTEAQPQADSASLDETQQFISDRNPAEICWVQGVWVKPLDGNTVVNVPSANDCHNYCLQTSDCEYFGYRYDTKECVMTENIVAVEKIEPSVTGPRNCHREKRKLLAPASSECFVEDMGIDGPATTTVYSLPSAQACQNLCRAQSSCQYFTWTAERCLLHSAASGLLVSDGAVCGPRSCTETEKKQSIEPTFHGESANDNEILFDTDDLFDATVSGGEATATSSTQSNGNSAGGLISNVLNAFSGGAGSVQSTEGVEPTLGGLGSALQSGVGALGNLNTVLSAADTVMNTIPIADLLNTGVSLANSGILSGGGVTNRHPSTSPPTGIDNPSVTCLSEGIRCCIPRLAAPNYKKNPPYLNGIVASECQTTYVSSSDQLCATTMYEDYTCGVEVVETLTLTVYRHTIHIPSNTMNNAICECAVSKQPNDDGTRTVAASGKWEYSLAAASEQAEKQGRANEAATKFSKAARMGVTWLEALSGGSNTPGGGSATGFINNLLDLTDNLRNTTTQKNGVPPK